jgi:hypothetical protein
MRCLSLITSKHALEYVLASSALVALLLQTFLALAVVDLLEVWL